MVELLITLIRVILCNTELSKTVIIHILEATELKIMFHLLLYQNMLAV